MTLQQLLGIDLPLLQAPMAGVQGSALAVAVCEAGGLGALPCAMLTPEAIRAEVAAIRARTGRPFNLNFFCHQPPTPDDAREAAWRASLTPYYRELGLDPAAIPAAPGRAPFSAALAELVAIVVGDEEPGRAVGQPCLQQSNGGKGPGQGTCLARLRAVKEFDGYEPFARHPQRGA